MLNILAFIISTLIAAMILAFIFTLGGCEILKSKRDVRTDSERVTRVDSGAIRTVSTDRNDSSTWFREIIEFLANKPSGDTTIVLQPNVTTPIRIIREGGTQVVSEKKEETESVWRNKYDSLMYHQTIEEKGKETRVATQWHIWLILGAVALVLFKLFFKLK